MAAIPITVTEQLRTVQFNFVFGFVGVISLKAQRPEEILRDTRLVVCEAGVLAVPGGRPLSIKTGPHRVIDVGPFSEKGLDEATFEFTKMLLRNFTTDSYEVLQAYCDTTGQRDAMRAQPWYQFARMVRNSITHTQHWKFNPHDLSRLPVSWRNKTIEASMDGQELQASFYSWWDACNLWDEMYSFAETLN